MTRRAHGEGSIDPRGPDTWRLRYRVNGKRFAVTVHGPKAAAQRELRRLLREGDTGEHVAPAKRTLAQWIDEWLMLIRGRITARTAERYRELLAMYALPTLGSRRLQALNVSEIDALYARLEQRLSTTTIRHVHVALKAALAVAVDKGHMKANPAARASLPRAVEPAVGQALDPVELRLLLDGFRGSTLFPIVVTAALTGARLGEVLALCWSDLDPVQKALRIERAIETTQAHGRRLKNPKTKRGERTIAIDATLLSLLLTEQERYQRLAAGVPDGAQVDLSLIRLPADALMFPSPSGKFDVTRLRNPKSVTKEEDEDAAVAHASAALRARLGWSSDSEARSAVVARFAPVAEALFLALPSEADRPASPADVRAALASFEAWYAETHARPFWALFEHYVPETPLVDF